MTNALPFHNDIVKFVESAESTVLDMVNDVAKQVADAVPSLPVAPSADVLDKAVELIDGGFDLTTDLLDQNRKFVGGLLAAVKTVIEAASGDEATVTEVKAAA